MNLTPRTEYNFKVALHADLSLGEGLHWDTSRSCLWFVDIHGRRLLRWSLDAPTWQEWKMEHRIGWVIPLDCSDELVLGLQPGFARASVDAPQVIRWIAHPYPHQPSMRLNDAKADRSGAIWAGSLDNSNEEAPAGELLRLDPDGALSRVDRGYCVANGPAISPDGRLFLHTDSLRRTIFAFDMDTASGMVHNKRVWKRFSAADGFPDGMCFDSEGAVWIAHWGVGRICRYASNGTLLHAVGLPATQTSNVCFAGERLDRLFVTSAHCGLSLQARAQQPLAGVLFEVDACGVRGLAGLPGIAA